MHVFNNEPLTIVCGAKGAGKSTFAAKLIRKCRKKGIKVYCNYPYKGAFQLPTELGKFGFRTLNKNYLYTGDFSNSVIIIDEASGIWNARSHKDFSEVDSHWFNMLRHINTQVFVITQYIDMIDLNIRRNATEILYLRKARFLLRNYTRVEIHECSVEKVAKLDQKSLNKKYDLVEFLVCVRNRGTRYFKRKRYFGDFDSYYIDIDLKRIDMPLWDNEVIFRPYIDKSIFSRLKRALFPPKAIPQGLGGNVNR